MQLMYTLQIHLAVRVTIVKRKMSENTNVSSGYIQ